MLMMIDTRFCCVQLMVFVGGASSPPPSQLRPVRPVVQLVTRGMSNSHRRSY